jgi:hypothetical protein
MQCNSSEYTFMRADQIKSILGDSGEINQFNLSNSNRNKIIDLVAKEFSRKSFSKNETVKRIHEIISGVLHTGVIDRNLSIKQIEQIFVKEIVTNCVRYFNNQRC